MATKTASGNNLAAARYSDSPGYFFDLSFSKNLINGRNIDLTPFGLTGFYSWQTNDELRLQNDAFMYAAGCDIASKNWQASASLSGYSGYKNERDRPMQLNFELAKIFNFGSVKFYYIYGLREWNHNTIRLSLIFRLGDGVY